MSKEPKLLLANNWDPDKHDPVGWWISEKLDGVRAYWDGRQFLSRQGNVFHAPDWFKRKLPKIALDGELWIGRGEFQLTVGTVKRLVPNENWNKIRYVVFDSPEMDLPFEDRISELDTIIPDNGWVELLDQDICRSMSFFQKRLQAVTTAGGEGLMLRQPGSFYEGKRSSTLLKVKQFLDAEATVVGHQPGKGKHEGRLGALHCILQNGVEFDIGTGFSDKERENPPKIGSTVTFRYQELTNAGVPRFPSFVRERK